MKSFKNNILIPKILPFTLLLALIFWGTSCSDTALSPGQHKKNKKIKTKSAPATFAPMIITISGIGTNKMTASARPLNSLPALRGTVSTPDDDSGKHGTGSKAEGTIKMDAISFGSFTLGVRPSSPKSINGWRYFYATYRVKMPIKTV